MKQIVCLISAVSFFFSLSAQVPNLCIASAKTTSLIFPFPITHVDRGTKDILVEQVPEAQNILLVKAASPNFSETNLSVITSDGSLYTFSVCYDKQPSVWVYQLPVQLAASIASYSNSLLDNPAIQHHIKTGKWDMEAKVSGIYIKGDVMFYQLMIENGSPIDYDIDYLRFYIRDQRKLKRTAIQETELSPLAVAGNQKQVKAASKTTIVVALQKFTIPDAKYVAIEIGERNGGRHLFLSLKNKQIMKAISLPDIH